MGEKYCHQHPQQLSHSSTVGYLRRNPHILLTRIELVARLVYGQATKLTTTRGMESIMMHSSYMCSIRNSSRSK